MADHSILLQWRTWAKRRVGFSAEMRVCLVEWKGVVTEVSSEGDLITDITAEQLRGAPADMSITVVCDEHETNGVFPLNHTEPAATFLAVIGRDGRLALTIVGESARMMLGIRVGEPVVVRW